MKKNNNTRYWVFISALVLFLSGCKKEPAIVFESDSYSIRAGESISLSWNTEIDNSAVISHEVEIESLGVVATQDSITLSPEITTTYQLTDHRILDNDEQVDIVRSITVHVDLLLADWVAKDKGLEQCVRERNSNALYAVEATNAECTQFIGSLEGLQYLNGITKVDVRNGLITDLTPLKTLRELSALFAFGHPIKSLEPIADLPELRLLGIIGSNVRDASPLARLQNPWILFLNANPFDESLLSLEAIVPKVTENSGWIDLRNSIVAIQSPPTIDCDILTQFRASTVNPDVIYWPSYCEY